MTDMAIIKADGEESVLKLHSNSATGMVYQRIFNRNFYNDVDSIRGAQEHPSIVQDIFPRVFFVWNLMYQRGNGVTIAEILKKTEMDYIEWLMDFSMNAFISPAAVSAFAEEYAKGAETHTTPKN
jgi:hypothetical protein